MTSGRAVPYLLPGLICSDYVWRAQLAALEPFAPVAVRGYGDADSLTAMARRVLADAPPRLAVAGHSMGGRVALEMFRLAPERIDRLALLDTGVHPVQAGEREKRMALLEIGRTQGMEALVDAWLPPMVHPARRGDADFMGALKVMSIAAGLDAFACQVRALLARPDATGLLAQIDVPALVAVGRDDQWSPVPQHEAMAAAIDNAQLVVFENAGHMTPVEAPEAVSEALRTWLER